MSQTDHESIEDVRALLIRYALLQRDCTKGEDGGPCATCAPILRVLKLAEIAADEIAGIGPKFALVTPIENAHEKKPRSFLPVFRTKAHAQPSNRE